MKVTTVVPTRKLAGALLLTVTGPSCGSVAEAEASQCRDRRIGGRD